MVIGGICLHMCVYNCIYETCAGDVGINPDSGQYRLSGEVAGVEVNELRKTLGVRPTPYSVGGAIRGVLHVTGPLDQPVFSGATQFVSTLTMCEKQWIATAYITESSAM